MNPEAQRIAIAEACGWKPDDDGDGTGWKGSRIRQRLIGKKPTFEDGKVVSYLIEQTVPDYLNDLNAMHEAEVILIGTEVQQAMFCYHLFRAIDPSMEGAGVGEFDKIHATTTQRAEAFLKTLGIWKEDAQ